MRNLLYYGVLLSLLTGCVLPTEEVLTEVNLDYNDKTLRSIYNFQNEAQVDSLYPYFNHKDPTYRYAAAMAFASIKDETGIAQLQGLLQDTIEDVRVAAAYALGQIGTERIPSILIANFEQQRPDDTIKLFRKSNAAILEAVGKSGEEEMLQFIATVRSYLPTDTLMLEGQAYSIYRYALRGITSKEGTQRMVELATNNSYPGSVRFIAANYLYRARNIKIGEYVDALVRTFTQSGDPRIRMTLAIALGKTQKQEALDALALRLSVERDYRVKCNIIRALKNFDYLQTKPLIEKEITNDNHHVSNVAAQFFLDNGNSRDATAYFRQAREDSLHWQSKITLLAAAQRHCPVYFGNTKNRINYETTQVFEGATNPYEKAAALRALAEYPYNFRYIKEKAFPADSKVIRTACIEALATICKREDFRQVFGARYWRTSLELTDYMVETIEAGDPGMVAVAAGLLADDQLFFKETLDSLDFIDVALNNFKLPRELETYNEMVKASNYLKGEDKPLYKEEKAMDIQWRNLDVLAGGKKAYINTSKGVIVLDLLADETPGTVANFIKLIKESFFDNKVFHRVVPNFVAQAGCPRGDGYGSLDYTIRSELPLMHYDQEGYVGMASAGNHTECSQFFITHSPTLHLDGNYTIFATVSEGMEVVHQLGVGDVIQNVTIK